MINSLSYKLIKQPNTISEEVFKPNVILTKFIKENRSRILVINASNSSGKSFLLNIIAYAFYALDLNKEDLPESLRRSINYLNDEGHQTIEYNISLSDPDGFNIESRRDAVTGKPIVFRKHGNTEQKVENVEFIEKYKLLYDIPEKPLDRIYQLLKSIKDFNSNLLNRLHPLDLKIDSILRSIREERDEAAIEKIKERIGLNQGLLGNYKRKNEEAQDKLKDLENQENLLKLGKLIDDYDMSSKEFNRVNDELKKLTPPSKDNIVLQNNSKLIELKTKIAELNIVNAINSFKGKVEDNDYSNKIKEILDQAEIKTLELIYKSNETVLDLINELNLEEINKIIGHLKQVKDYSFNNFFEHLKKDLNEDDFNIIKKLTSDFEKYEADYRSDSIVKAVFDKSIAEILNDLRRHQHKFDEITKINDLQSSINSSIENIISKLNQGKTYGRELFQENKKQKKAPKEHKLYNDTLNKKNHLSNIKNKQSEQIHLIRLGLGNKGIPLENLNSIENINKIAAELKIKNMPFQGKNTFFEEELLKYKTLIPDLEAALGEDKLKLKIEESKVKSEYSDYKDTIQMFSNKLSYFTKWLHENDALIKGNGELDTKNFEKNSHYMKLIGEFIASLMGNKILYQNRTINIIYIDYSKATPCFVTDEGKRIAFSDFSGGQGSSNYLKAKLNINENRKYIVLLDEIANMDNKSLNEVIERLKDLEKKEKLLLAVLVEPAKEENVFTIQAY